MIEVMAKANWIETDETEKEFYFSERLEKARGGNRQSFVNGKKYSFAVRKGKSRKTIQYYEDKYGDVELVFTGRLGDCRFKFLREKINKN